MNNYFRTAVHYFCKLTLISIIFHSSLSAQSPFITVWKTDNIGSSCDSCITIPTIGSGYNYSIDIEADGSYEYNNITGDITINLGKVHAFVEIAINGDFPRIYFNSSGDRRKLLEVLQWGDIAWTSMGKAFSGCLNLHINTSVEDQPELSQVTDLSSMFNDCRALNESINHWDVSTIENMEAMFVNTFSFNQPLDEWDVCNVKNMRWMFANSNFNQNINPWNVMNVTHMGSMFRDATFTINLWINGMCRM